MITFEQPFADLTVPLPVRLMVARMQKPLDQLTRADLVQILALASRNRRAIKRYLHDRDFPSGAESVDEVLALINRQPDAKVIVAEAAKVNAAQHAPSHFTLAGQLVRVLADRSLVGQPAIDYLARHTQIDREQIQQFLNGGDISTRHAEALLRAAGALRIQFADPNQST